ncbi:hypothetical protein FPSE5266_11431, partial [Fusarium pseudograminearum]
MSTHHQDNTTTEISSLEITPARPRQEGKLALLPSEILLKILNDTEITQKPVEQNPRLLHPLKNPGTIDVCTNVLSAPDVKNLALASSSLFHRLSPSFYLAGNYYAFRSAVKYADIAAMKRCAEFGAAPDMHWELEGECECRGEQVHLSHRPIDVLLEQVKSCSIPMGKSIEALHWLLDNGYDVYEQPVSLSYEKWPSIDVSQEQLEDARVKLKTVSMPEILMSALSVSAGDRDRTAGICQMIDMLLGHGCLIPYNFNQRAHSYHSNPSHVFTPMEVAMMSHCPPHFLEVLLELYKRHDAHDQRTADTCPESMSRWVGWNPFEQDVGLRMRQEWMHGSDLGKLARNLFLDLLDPARDWKEEYYGETADIFTEKINLMEKYDFIDSSEIVALRCILRSLLRITSMAVFAGGLDKARHGKHCFEIMISESLILIAPTLLGPYLSRWFDEGPHRVHRFEFDRRWNPWADYYLMQLQDKDISDEHSHAPWIRKGDLTREADGTVRDRKFGPLVSLIPRPRPRTELRWTRYDYDEFIEMVSEAFDMYEKERHKWEARKLLQLERHQMQAFSQLRTLLVEPGEEEEE